MSPLTVIFGRYFTSNAQCDSTVSRCFTHQLNNVMMRTIDNRLIIHRKDFITRSKPSVDFGSATFYNVSYGYLVTEIHEYKKSIPFLFLYAMYFSIQYLRPFLRTTNDTKTESGLLSFNGHHSFVIIAILTIHLNRAGHFSSIRSTQNTSD